MNPTTSTNSASPADHAGLLLREARERKGLTEEDLASFLHLRREFIVSLESWQFIDLPAPAYVRGYIRAIARHTEIDPNPILSAFNAEHPEDTLQVAPVQTPQVRAGDQPVKIVSFVVATTCIGLFAWWWFEDQKAAEETARPALEVESHGVDYEFPTVVHEDTATVSVERVVTMTTTEATQPTDDADPMAAPTSPDSMETVQPAAETGTEPAAELAEAVAQTQSTDTVTDSQPDAAVDEPPGVGIDDVGISLALRDTAWLEIYDANDARLFYDLGKPDELINLSGQAPLRLKIGNSPAVRLTIEGEMVDLTPFDVNGIARLSVGSDGSTSAL